MREIDFVERVDIFSEFADALYMSREALGFGISGDADGMAIAMSTVYPKLRFISLNVGRYRFAANFVKDGDFIIDVPCGTGYGTVLLASGGNNVLGLDINKKTIDSASDMYRFPNIEFRVADMMSDELPVADFITCLDGLEHVSPGRELIDRFHNALSDNGTLVVSVPINELKITGGVENPYHEEDYDYDSLNSLLGEYFSSVKIFGHDQYGIITSAKFAFDGLTAVCKK